MAAILMLSLAGAGATRSHCVPAPDLWVPLDADLATMGFFSPRSDLFTALPAERFASLAGGIRCGTGDERCFLIESREQVTIFFSKGRTGVEPKSPRWPRSSLQLAIGLASLLLNLHGARRGRRLAQRAAHDDAGLRDRRSQARGARGIATRGLPGGTWHSGTGVWCALCCYAKTSSLWPAFFPARARQATRAPLQTAWSPDQLAAARRRQHV